MADEVAAARQRRRRRLSAAAGVPESDDVEAVRAAVGQQQVVGDGDDNYDESRGLLKTKQNYAEDKHLKPERRNRKKRRDYKSRHRNDDNDDISFPALVLRVAFVLALLCLAFFSLYRYFVPAPLPATDLDDDGFGGGGDDDDYHVLGRDPQELLHQEQAEDRLTEQRVGAGGGIELPKLRVRVLPPPADSAGVVTDDVGLGSDPDEQGEEKVPPLPVWNLTDATAAWDAFGIAERFAPPAPAADSSSSQPSMFWQAAAGLRTQFAEYYGGVNAARAILERGLTTFGNTTATTGGEEDKAEVVPSDLRVTACRIRRARDEKRPFRFAFGGYSVTTGRGNLFSQSYPFVMESRLHTVFSLLGIKLKVDNAAIGGIPSFPYGWCMRNFWGADPDVVSWDYSMNEAGGDPIGLEAYLRHALQLPNQPKLIVKDTHLAAERRNLLREYVARASTNSSSKPGKNDAPLRLDPVVVHTDPAAAPFLERRDDERHRPEGFREWRKWGSPNGAPGQAKHHPAVKEHEFIAWLLTMHFLSALELVAAADDERKVADRNSRTFLRCDDMNGAAKEQEFYLPRPIVSTEKELFNATSSISEKPWASLFYGEPMSSSAPLVSVAEANNRWKMNPIRCRTTFEPRESGDLSEAVLSGRAGEGLDVMLPKSLMYYNHGWVLDLSESEKKAKRNLDRFGGLGFRDSKKAYYGLFTSGALRLFLPYDNVGGRNISTATSVVPKVGDRASDWFKSVVVCEANEKRTDNLVVVVGSSPCNPETDVSYGIDGTNVTANATMIDAMGALYLGRKLCTYLPVPSSAKLTTRRMLEKEEAERLRRQQHLLVMTDGNEGENGRGRQSNNDPDRVGVTVEIRVRNRHVMKPEQACSVSHVVWEQRRRHPPSASEQR